MLDARACTLRHTLAYPSWCRLLGEPIPQPPASRPPTANETGLLRAAAPAPAVGVHARLGARVRGLRDAGRHLHLRVAGGERSPHGEEGALQLHLSERSGEPDGVDHRGAPLLFDADLAGAT